MRQSELERIKAGDQVKLVFDVLRAPQDKADDFYLKTANTKFYVSQKDMLEYGEYVPRKYKKQDLVEYLGDKYVLQEDENEFGNVLIEHPDMYIGAKKLTLIMPAKKVRELKPWKGGEE